MPGAGVIYGAVQRASIYYLFVQEWNPGSGSFLDLFENLGKSFIMSVFLNYSLASSLALWINEPLFVNLV